MGNPDRLELTEDEAYALLSLCMTSNLQLDPQSELALRKLANFCKSHRNSHLDTDGHKQPQTGFVTG
ncbi:MAG: hypothetical protein JNM34_02820 [Chthonomonadaceae bacterium]|nr:hypothetical protein [Chthonomonadaceae bacterium]